MARLDDALDNWPGATADYQGMRIEVGRTDELRNGVDWEGWEVSATKLADDSLVAVQNIDDIDDIADILSQPPISIPPEYDGWYWIDAYGRKRLEANA
jgi:hypothetical protein